MHLSGWVKLLCVDGMACRVGWVSQSVVLRIVLSSSSTSLLFRFLDRVSLDFIDTAGMGLTVLIEVVEDDPLNLPAAKLFLKYTHCFQQKLVPLL